MRELLHRLPPAERRGRQAVRHDRRGTISGCIGKARRRMANHTAPRRFRLVPKSRRLCRLEPWVQRLGNRNGGACSQRPLRCSLRRQFAYPLTHLTEHMTGATEPLLIVKSEDGTTAISINRPERRNALSIDTLDLLRS